MTVKIDGSIVARVVRGEDIAVQLWVLERNGVGHAIVSTEGPIVAACGKGMRGWRHATVIERRPRIVCEDCRRVVDGEPPRRKPGSDPKRETQGRMF